jgi:hypothetical protein
MNDPYGAPPPGPPVYATQGYAQPPQKSKMATSGIVAVFVGALIAFAIIAAIFVVLNQPPPPVTPCQPAQPCAPVPSLPPVASSPGALPTPRPVTSPAVTLAPGATPPAGASLPPVATPGSDSPPVVTGTLYSDSSLGYSFEYDPEAFELAEHGDGVAVLSSKHFDAQVWIDAKTADTAPRQMIQTELADVDRFLLARVTDEDTYDAVLGPSVGYVPGEGGVWSGTIVSRDGTPLAPGGVTIVSASDGRITVAVVVIVGTPDARQGGETQQHAARSAADDIVKTFQWSAP